MYSLCLTLFIPDDTGSRYFGDRTNTQTHWRVAGQLNGEKGIQMET